MPPRFDAFVEAQCAPFYAHGVGRPSLAPGRYFRLLLLGYFEGLDSERAIAWRAAEASGIATPTRAELARFDPEAEEEGVQRRLDAPELYRLAAGGGTDRASQAPRDCPCRTSLLVFVRTFRLFLECGYLNESADLLARTTIWSQKRTELKMPWRLVPGGFDPPSLGLFCGCP